MDKKEVLHIIEQGEDECAEFKTSFGKEVIESIVAFSNSKGGKVIVGVNDNKTIVVFTIIEYPIKPVSFRNKYFKRIANSKHLMVEYIITGEPQRVERFDYPLDAIREIVINMVVHRDYRDSSASTIKIYDDRIEFYNPGSLYGGLTIQDLLSVDTTGYFYNNKRTINKSNLHNTV